MLCEICAREDAVWLYPLHEEKLHFRLHGKGYTRHFELMVGDGCRALWDAADDAELIALMDGPDAAFMVALMRQASASATAAWYDDTLPAGVTALRELGFTPIEELTGLVEVAESWPAEHRRSLPEIRPCWLEAGHSEFQMVRSPSPELDIRDYLTILIQSFERIEKSVSHPDP